VDRPRLAFIAAAQAESLLGRIDEAVALRDECRRISESLGAVSEGGSRADVPFVVGVA
jgi:hypothetical protein